MKLIKLILKIMKMKEHLCSDIAFIIDTVAQEM